MASDRGGDMRLIYDNIKEQAAVMPDPVLVTLHKESLLGGRAVFRSGLGMLLRRCSVAATSCLHRAVGRR